ncbi:MAG: Ni/Fe-hydrogenase, b-type cytochrome subunit [Desulfovibrio sp.]|nr:Ni/Fe-hydrogenase, b-type cytochrome subunit [Desulfovibrio sp.]
MNVLNVKPKPGQGVYVYEFPVRAWHWTIAACIFTLFVSGYCIANPPQSLTGDPTRIFHFGHIIMTHYIAGMILAFAMVCRLIWAFFGNSVSREIFIVPIWRKSWWKGLEGDIKWYLFIKKTPDINMGHNPLAQAAMFFAVLCMFYMCFTGLGIYSSKGYSSFFGIFHFMENLTYNAGGNGIDLVLWHRMGMVFLVAFVIIHTYMVIREEIMGRTTMISSMVNGVRLVKATLMQDWLDLRSEEKIGDDKTKE